MYCGKKISCSVCLCQDLCHFGAEYIVTVYLYFVKNPGKIFFWAYVVRNFAVINLLFSVFSYRSFIKGFHKFVL